MSVISLIKFLFLTTFLLAVIYFSYRGFVQVMANQTSSRAEYRFGDDDKGNLELFDITVCPVKEQLKFLAIYRNGNNLTELLKEASKSVDFNQFIWAISLDNNYKTNLTYSKSYSTNDWIPKWTHVLDWQSGHCYTFSPKAQGMNKTPLNSDVVYDNSQVQKIVFTVIAESLSRRVQNILPSKEATHTNLMLFFQRIP